MTVKNTPVCGGKEWIIIWIFLAVHVSGKERGPRSTPRPAWSSDGSVCQNFSAKFAFADLRPLQDDDRRRRLHHRRQRKHQSGANVIKLFTAVSYDFHNKLERLFLVPGKPFRPSLILVGKPTSLFWKVVTYGRKMFYNIGHRCRSIFSLLHWDSGACTIKKHYGFIMYGFRSKLVCLYKLVSLWLTKEDTSLLQNLSVFCL